MVSEKNLYVDSLDGVEALIEIEKTFNISIPDEEAQHIQNVGHLFDYVIDRIPENCGEKCASSMVFYHLKRDLKLIAPDLKLKPTTQLQGISNDSPKAFWGKLNQTSTLNLPHLEYGLRGNIGLYSASLSVCALILMLFIKPSVSITFGLGLTILLAIALAKNDPQRFPKMLQNVGDLTNEAIMLNHGKLIQEGARMNKNDHWNILTLILASWSGVFEKDQIKRSTPFY